MINEANESNTCWMLIGGAARGDVVATENFARLYEPIIRAFLLQRWRIRLAELDVDDGVQDVFLECFRKDGPLQRFEVNPSSGFRGFLFGVVRNVARRHEERLAIRNRRDGPLPEHEIEVDETGAETAFDRAWARSMMREAARAMEVNAAELDRSSGDQGGRAMRRVELLRRRFQDEMPIRDIARQWDVNADWLHHEYATARSEFRDALMQVISSHFPAGTTAQRDQACRDLLRALE